MYHPTRTSPRHSGHLTFCRLAVALAAKGGALLALMLALVSGMAPRGEAQSFTAVGNLSAFRSQHLATRLPNGKVLMVGGSINGLGEVYDPTLKTFTVTSGNVMTPTTAGGETSVVLSDGTILSAGGTLSGGTSPTAVATVYNPTTQTLTTVGSLTTARLLSASVLLADGTVLIAGGWTTFSGSSTTKSAELYNPTTQTFSPTNGAMSQVTDGLTATRLADGKVLITNAYFWGELYNPTTKTFSTTNLYTTVRFGATATLLSDGTVLITGGAGSSTLPTKGEIYNPATNSFTATTGAMVTPRYNHTATLLSDNTILITGGQDAITGAILTSAEIYNPTTKTYSAVPAAMTAPRYKHRATLLADNTVLVSGGTGEGYIGLKSAEVYQAVTPPVITSFTPTSGPVGTSVTITGTNFTGATSVKFNGASATTFTVNSSTTITVTVPDIATTGKIIVVTPSGTATSTSDYTVPAVTTPAAPTVTTAAATSITRTTVTLNGYVNPNALTTSARFQYGPTLTYGPSRAVTLSPPNGGTTQTVSATLTGLPPNTLFHFRATASNGVGLTNGTDFTFTTLPNSAPVTSNLSVSTWAGRAIISRPTAATDADGDTLTYALGTSPSHGSVGEVLSTDGLFLYTPTAGYVGTDSFTLYVSDGYGAPSYLTVSVTVGAAPSAGTKIYTSVGASDCNAVGASDFAHGYTSLMLGKMNTMYGAGKWALSNRGVNGFTTADLRRVVGGQTVLSLATADTPKAVTLWIGPNDAVGFYYANLAQNSTVANGLISQFYSDYYTVMTGLKGTGAAIVTANVPKIGDLPVATALGLTTQQKTYLNDICGNISTQINNVASGQSVPYYNLYNGTTPLLSSEISADGFHPNDAGYAKFVTVGWPLLRPQLNRVPVGADLSVSGNAGQNITGTVTASDADLDEGAFTFTKATEPASGTVTLNATTGAFTYTPNTGYAGSDSFTYTAANSTGTSAAKTVSITVIQSNHPPTDFLLSGDSIAENNNPTAQIGAFYGPVDPDGDETFTYSLVAGGDSTAFTITGDKLNAAISYDYETKNSYSITVTVTDAAGASFNKQFTISITDVNENETPSTMVTTTSDASTNSDDLISLREAIGYAAAGGEVTFALPDAQKVNGVWTITLGSGLTITKNLTITGAGANLLSVKSPTQGAFNLLTISGGITATVSGLTLNNGTSGIYNSGTVTANYCVLSGNTDNGLSNYGNATLSRSAITGNASGLYNNGGAILNVADSTVIANTHNGLGNNGSVSFSSCTITGNNVGISNSNTATVINTILVGNNADTGGNRGVFNYSSTVGGTLAATGLEVGVDGKAVFKDNGGPTPTVALVSASGSAVNSGNNAYTAVPYDQRGVGYTRTLGGTVDRGAYESNFVPNTAPTNITLSNSSIAENSAVGSIVGTLSTTDADAGDTFTYSLAAGGDNAAFAIAGDKLKATASFDFEVKTSYSITVIATDAAGASVTKQFTITVTNVNEAPTDVALSNSSIAENSAVGSIVGTLSTTDVDAGDTFTYTLATGTGDTDNASFTIAGNSLKTAASFDFETKASYSIRLKTIDAAGASFEKAFTISVTDVSENTAPTDLALSNTSIAENEAAGSEVGTLSATDADAGETFTYSLAAGGDNASFAIAGDKLNTAASFDYETKDTYTISVTVTDAAGASYNKAFNITVTDVAEVETPSTIVTTTSDASTSTDGLISLREAIGYATAGDTITFAIPEDQKVDDKWTITLGSELLIDKDLTLTGSGAKLLTVNSATQGAFNLLTISDGITATVSGLTLDNGASDIYNSGTLTVNDSVLSGGSDAGLSNYGHATLSGLAIFGNGSGLYNNGGAIIDLSNSTLANNTYNGLGNNGAFQCNNSTITGNNYGISNYNTATVRNTIVAGNNGDLGGDEGVASSYSTVGGTPAAAGLEVDGDGKAVLKDNGGPTPTIALVSATGSAINGGYNDFIGYLATDQRGAGYVRIKGGTVDRGAFESNFAAFPTLSISSVAVNEGASGTKDLTFTVSLSVPAFAGGATFDIATVNGTGVSVALSGSDYIAKSLTGQTIPEGESTYSFTVQVNGDYVVENDETFAVNVTNAAGTQNATASGTGTITNDDHAPILTSFTPTSGKAGTVVTITGNYFISNAGVSFAGQTSDQFSPSVTVNSATSITATAPTGVKTGRIKVYTFSGMATSTIDFTLSNTPPVAQSQSVALNEDTPTAIHLGASDPDFDPITGSVVTSPTHGTLSGTAPNLTYTPTANYSGTDSFTFKVNDGKADSNIEIVSITVIAVNDAPTDLALSNSSVAENAAVGTTVGTLSSTDADAGETFTYDFAVGEDDTDNASFTIAGNSLKTAASFDFETKASYSIRLKTIDAAGASFEKAFTISVTDVSENTAPTDLALSNTSIAENEAAGSEVGTLSATDADTGETFTYSLAAGGDNASFAIAGDKLNTAASFDYETKNSYSITIIATDAAGASVTKQFTITVTDVNESETPSTIVTTTSDASTSSDGLISLREAIGYASAGGEVTFAIPEAQKVDGVWTIALGSGLTVDKNLTITGSGAKLLSVKSPTKGAFNLLTISGGITATVSGLTFDNGASDIYNSGTVMVNDSVLSGGSGDGLSNYGNATLSGLAIFGNGSGLYNNGGAILNASNTTIANNTNNGVGNNGAFAFNNCTITGNNYGISNYNTATIRNTILAGNNGNTGGPQAVSPSYSTVGGTVAASGLEVDSNGKAVLKDNGGLTPTIALVSVTGSAINRGYNDFIGYLSTDQRGAGYVRIKGGTVDRGAFESSFVPNNAPTISTSSLPGAQVSAAYSQTLAGNDPDGDTLTWSISAGALPAGLTLSSSGVLSGAPIAAGNFSFIVTVSDGNGGSASKSLSLTVTARVNTAPLISVTAPNTGDLVVRTAFLTTLAGTATDDAGVSRATILLFRRKNGTFTTEFWNGTAWGSTQVYVPLHLATVGATSTAWNWTQQTPSASNLEAGLYGFFVQDTDTDNVSSALIRRDFTLSGVPDDAAPVISVTAPNNAANVERTAFLTTLAGGATDDYGVSRAAISFFRRKNGTSTTEFWSGTAWGATQIFVPLQLGSAGATSTTWSWTQQTPSASDLEAGPYGFYVQAVDIDGRPSVPVRRDFTLVPPANNVAPVINVTAPNNGDGVVRPSFLTILGGTATDDYGVSRAAISLFRKRNGVNEFWSGTAWGTAQIFVPLHLTTVGATSTNWDWTQQTPAASNLDSGAYSFYVSATDADNVTSALVRRDFTLAPLNNAVPRISVTAPSNGASVVRSSFLTTLNGSATDDYGVSRAAISLFRKRNGVNEFWSGTAWGTAQIFVPLHLTTVGATSTNWDWTQQAPTASDLDSGLYSFYVQATDTDNVDGALVRCDFSLVPPANNVAPVISVTAPNNGAGVVRTTFLTTLGGGATDDYGVSRASISLFRRKGATTEYWNGTVWGAAQVFVPLHLTSTGATSTNWDWTQQAPSASDLQSGYYGFYVQATDNDNVASALVRRDFTLVPPTNNAAPVITVTAPNNGASVASSSFLTILGGNATDDYGVSGASIVLFRRKNNTTTTEFWNSTAWGATQVYVPLHLVSTGATSTAWNWTQQTPAASDLSAGFYGFYVQATDLDNAFSPLVRRDFTLTVSSASAQSLPSVLAPTEGPSGGNS